MLVKITSLHYVNTISMIDDCWVMRDLWNAAKLPKKEEKGKINEPIKLQSIGVKRLVERALWAQGVRTVLEEGKKSHEFQTDHGFRKSTNSYYRAASDEILKDYLKAVPLLTISSENRLKQMQDVMEQSKSSTDNIKSELYEKEHAITSLTESNSLNTDAIAALSDQVMKLMREIEILKKQILSVYLFSSSLCYLYFYFFSPVFLTLALSA